jgi:4-hydroxybenzoate polyprenyltransferase
MLRLEDWAPWYLPVPVAAAVLAGGGIGEVLVVGFVFFCIIAYGFVINNYFDAAIDSNHSYKKLHNKNPLAVKKIERRATLYMMVLLVSLSLAASFLSPPVGILFVVLTLLAFTAYSAPMAGARSKLKEIPYVDLVTHGLMFGTFPFVAGITMCGGSFVEGLVLVGVIVTLQAAIALVIHQLVDYEEDEAMGKTTVVRMGLRNAWRVFFSAMLLNACMLEAAFWLYDLHAVCHVFTVIYLLIFLRFVKVANASGAVKRKKLLIFIQSYMGLSLFVTAFAVVFF